MSIYARNLSCCSQGGLDKTLLALVLVASEEEQDSNFRCEEESRATKSALIWCQCLFSRQKYIKSFKIKIKANEIRDFSSCCTNILVIDLCAQQGEGEGEGGRINNGLLLLNLFVYKLEL